MSLDLHMLWREPLAPTWKDSIDWLKQELCSTERDNNAISRHLRRVGSMRLDDSERLQLHRLVKLARGSELPGWRDFRLLILSNRTTAYFGAAVEAAGAARSLLIEAVEGEYDTVNVLALSPTSEPPPGEFDAVLLMLDHGFLCREERLLDSAGEAEMIEGVRAQIGALVTGLRTKIGAPVIVSNVPIGEESRVASADLATEGSYVRLCHAINCVIADGARDGQFILFDLASIAAKIGTSLFFDPVRFFQAKLPFSFEAAPIVADSLAAIISAMTGRAGRVLVLDLDNTVWGGVIADDGLCEIVIGQGSPQGEAFLEIQRYALRLRERGVLLAVCSKNLEETAKEPFRSHPDMLLREEHIAIFVANFDDKATNIARIGKALDLDTSSLVFLDDNPAERERVRSSLPFTMVPEIPDDPAFYVRALTSSGFFEHMNLTKEDRVRCDSYRARAAAKSLQSSIGDYDAYLRSLEMELTIQPFDAIGRARIAQLIQKSNQFNLTSKRYSETEVAGIETDARRLGWQVRLKDRFTDHGMISVIIADKGGNSWSVDTWLMSCRVLERGVERAVMHEFARLANESGAKELIGTYRPTARNKLVKDFYPKLGFSLVKTTPEEDFYVLSLNNLSGLVSEHFKHIEVKT